MTTDVEHGTPLPLPPEAWAPARRLARKVFEPIEHFLHVEAAGGVVLLVAALAALAWANSPWAAAYDHLWHTEVTIGVGAAIAKPSLHFLVNEGLMAVFFFVVGLEIRREIHQGELSRWKSAALPVVAALGGMAAPALIYFAINRGGPTARGWGVPMATDIAFAVGVLTALGKRAPPALRVFLLALAIIDDIGAIVVIALFFSSGISLGGVALALGALGAIVLLQRVGVRNPWLYVPAGAALWAGFLTAGVHPTLAGVALGLLTPARAWLGARGFAEAARRVADEVEGRADEPEREAHVVLGLLRRLKIARREVLPPGTRLQVALHPWVAFAIMPLFAFANAGVRVGGFDLGEASARATMLGVVAGLVVGKPLGVCLASYAAVRAGVAALPGGVRWRGVLVVGLVAGIGFTMAIFMAGLAFETEALLQASKLAVLVGSALAAVAALLVGRMGAASRDAGAAATAAEAEASAER
ncbi:MAG TPA: Na+/H+ antiporter NhaA [Polyangiaceae bacterium]|nr:Na+/H+ antiporter NhaA [Polyangiaceae bacterium]